jgi:hypothetical protein
MAKAAAADDLPKIAAKIEDCQRELDELAARTAGTVAITKVSTVTIDGVDIQVTTFRDEELDR